MPEVFEHEDEVVVVLNLPGVKEEAVLVAVEGDVLVVSVSEGERPYQREVVLPCAVDADRMQVAYERGRLRVALPKRR